MDIQKERPIFDAWHYQDWRSNISANINESEYLEWYQRIYSHFATQQERELQFKTWLAAKSQAIPEGFVLVEEKSLTDTYYWDGAEYVVHHPEEYEMELEKGEIAELEKWQCTKSTKVYFANIYSNEDDFELVEFSTEQRAKRAIDENKAMIEAAEDKGL